MRDGKQAGDEACVHERESERETTTPAASS